MASYIENRCTRVSLGQQFEGDVVWEIKKVFPKYVKVMIGTAADKFDGTDLKIGSVPVDITTDFAGKDHTTEVGEAIKLPSMGTIRFGIRTGNSHHGYTPFEKPVLVIGIDTYYTMLQNLYNDVFSEIKKVLTDAVKTGYRLYKQTVSV